MGTQGHEVFRTRRLGIPLMKLYGHIGLMECGIPRWIHMGI